MIQANEIAAAFGLPCLLSGDMQTALQLWEDLYQNRANWQKERVKPLRLPAMIARELKRLALTEFVLDTKDTELQLPLQHTKQMLRQKLDYGIVSGGLLLKPYYHNGLQIDFVAQNQYLPVRYTNDACTAVICPEELVLEKRCYTRLEFHQFDEQIHPHHPAAVLPLPYAWHAGAGMRFDRSTAMGKSVATKNILRCIPAAVCDVPDARSKQH